MLHDITVNQNTSSILEKLSTYLYNWSIGIYGDKEHEQ